MTGYAKIRNDPSGVPADHPGTDLSFPSEVSFIHSGTINMMKNICTKQDATVPAALLIKGTRIRFTA